MSKSPLFRRSFSSVYDVLNEGRLELDALRQVLDECQPTTAEQISGYEVYARFPVAAAKKEGDHP